MPNDLDFLDDLLDAPVTLDELRHEYDPVKAREYYLRTRELKGRKRGATKTPVARTNRPGANKPAAPRKSQAAAKKERAARLKRTAEARVTKLKARLAKLEKVLSDLTKQSKAKNDIASTTSAKASTAKKASAGKSSDSKPLTASQKRDAAKRSAEYREKNDKGGDQSLASQSKELEAKIKKVRESITKMKAKLAAAKKQANSRTVSNRR